MEHEIYENEVRKENITAVGNLKQTDARKALQRLVVRRAICPEDSSKVVWLIFRNRTVILSILTASDVTREDVLHDARMLQLKGFKEAFERKTAIPIPQDYLDEVGWKA